MLSALDSFIANSCTNASCASLVSWPLADDEDIARVVTDGGKELLHWTWPFSTTSFVSNSKSHLFCQPVSLRLSRSSLCSRKTLESARIHAT